MSDIARNRTLIINAASGTDPQIIVAPTNDAGEKISVLRMIIQQITSTRNIALKLKDKNVSPENVITFTEIGVTPALPLYETSDLITYLTPYQEVTIAKNCELYFEVVGSALAANDEVQVFVESTTIPNVA